MGTANTRFSREFDLFYRNVFPHLASTFVSGYAAYHLGGGPRAAALAGLGGLLGSLAFGAATASDHTWHPGGPQNAMDAMDTLGGRTAQTALAGSRQGAFNTEAPHEDAAPRFFQNLGAGHSPRQAHQMAGGNQHRAEISRAHTSAVRNRVQGMSGISPVTATALGNGWMRHALGSTGKSSAMYGSVNEGIRGNSTGLASTAMQAFIGPGAGASGPEPVTEGMRGRQRPGRYPQAVGARPTASLGDAGVIGGAPQPRQAATAATVPTGQRPMSQQLFRSAVQSQLTATDHLPVTVR